MSTVVDTDTCTTAPTRDRCVTPCPSVGFKVELLNTKGTPEVPVIVPNEAFTLKVTALVGEAFSTVVSSGDDFVTLSDARAFPSSGSAVIVSGTTGTRFTWSGKSGDTLTGASGHGTPSVNDAVTLYSGAVDTGYAGACQVSAKTKCTAVTVDTPTISSDDWTNGVATITTIKLTNNPTDYEAAPVDVSVVEQALGSRGREGSDRATLVQPGSSVFTVDAKEHCDCVEDPDTGKVSLGTLPAGVYRFTNLGGAVRWGGGQPWNQCWSWNCNGCYPYIEFVCWAIYVKVRVDIAQLPTFTTSGWPTVEEAERAGVGQSVDLVVYHGDAAHAWYQDDNPLDNAGSITYSFRDATS